LETIWLWELSHKIHKATEDGLVPKSMNLRVGLRHLIDIDDFVDVVTELPYILYKIRLVYLRDSIRRKTHSYQRLCFSLKPSDLFPCVAGKA